MQHIGALLLSLAAAAAAVPAGNLPRAASASNSAPFQIYAYGEGIGGLPLFSAGSDAFLGDYAKFNDPNAAPVTFTPTNNAWQGAPNTTALNYTAAPNWSNLTFSIPTDDASDHSVAFLGSNSTASGRRTSGFLTYGNVIFVSGGSGNMESMWYATPSSVDGIYSLKWNATGDSSEDKIILALKKTIPSTALFPAFQQV
ncbi:hypothetical protein CGRA01v4_14908 [Colletotrichum graminicola]|uniref:Uncharacterized protein n=1 Tax=Colletotrichum graminicola (strain M1.001 / M2 / FGSC 10212) TaxID=645133 RepID=E3QFI5_COLGM|nr:uncharacterized protein GLRG_04767 [Colletotrichum graminicola M1.001]EFQ29623.1 hypothetical protein GLRG_04767 [Colletotrichum graminicola M1.001]WDK23616.1 hypothetical protein CGRA01v4_14908 [Colletotrichum graminicola]